MSRLVHARVLAFCLLFSTMSWAQESSTTSLSSLSLPGFQLEQVRADAPFFSMAMDDRGVVWLPGRDSVWRWSTVDNSLQKIGPLIQKSTSSDRLRHVGSDGTSLFVASDQRLFQIQGVPRRVLMYPIPSGSGGSESTSLGFAGEGDNFWWLTTRRALRIDRYGKVLKSAARPLKLLSSDLTAFDPATQTLWVAREKSVVSLDLKDPKAKPVRITRTTREIRGLEFQNDEVWLWTDYAVVRLEPDGKRIQTIPVQAGRKLTTVDINSDRHTFLFNDGLLEIYDVKRGQVTRQTLPELPSNPEKSSESVALSMSSSDTFAVLAGGIPSVFRISSVRVFGDKSKK